VSYGFLRNTVIFLTSFVEALQEYILGAGQHTPGGLRDKPGKKADIYHTFYSLAGLSSAQHRVYQSKKLEAELLDTWKDSTSFVPSQAVAESDEDRQRRRRTIWSYSRSWKEDETSHKYVGSSKNRVVSETLKLLLSVN
jgi:protein farnesyltransferase subunit beta